MKKWGCQAVVAQTAFNAVIGMDLLRAGLEGCGRFGTRSLPA